MKRSVYRVALLALLFCAVFVSARAEETPAVLYFHETICETCDPDEEFAATFLSLTGQPLTGYRYRSYNVLTSAGKQMLSETAAQYGVEKPTLPLVVLGGKVYMGTKAIQTALPEDFLQSSGATDSVIYYLYVPACESCARVEQALSALPASVWVTRGLYAFDSKIAVRKIDVSRETGAALALFERFHVPDADRVAPIVFLSDRYLAGADTIVDRLPGAVRAGFAVGNGAPPAAPARLPVLGLAGTIAAGLAGGLNPCALSMLLLFLSLLAGADRPAGRLAALFLGGKFAAYLGIGTALLGVFQLFNPVWLATAVKLLLTALCAALIALNLMDAAAARRQEMGRIKNQLPARFRGFLRRRIEAAFARKKSAAVAAAALGALVAGGEFLCAGQVYLATLLASVRSGIATLPAFGLLCAYCAAFLLPSAALAALVLRGRAAISVSVFLSRHMAVIKVLTALTLAAILAYVWIA